MVQGSRRWKAGQEMEKLRGNAAGAPAEQKGEPETKPGEKKKAKPAVRVSETDPEARVMKQADGGFAPSYNGCSPLTFRDKQ